MYLRPYSTQDKVCMYFAQDQRAPYRYWAEVLRAMESHAPGQRFLLKTPGHTPWMGAIVDAMFMELLATSRAVARFRLWTVLESRKS